MGSNPISRSKRIAVKRKIEVEDLIHIPAWRGTATSMLKSRRDFDMVFEDENYYLRPKKVNQPNLGPWNLYLRKNQLAHHNGCGIIAQRYSAKHGESGRPFCTKCGQTLGRVAREMLTGWEGTLFPIRREGLQAFFLTPELPKIEEIVQAAPAISLRATTLPSYNPEPEPRSSWDHSANCGCPDCHYEPSLPEPDGSDGPPMVRTTDGNYRYLEFLHLGFRLCFSRQTISESDFEEVVDHLRMLEADSDQECILWAAEVALENQGINRREAVREKRENT